MRPRGLALPATAGLGHSEGEPGKSGRPAERSPSQDGWSSERYPPSLGPPPPPLSSLKVREVYAGQESTGVSQHQEAARHRGEEARDFSLPAQGTHRAQPSQPELPATLPPFPTPPSVLCTFTSCLLATPLFQPTVSVTAAGLPFRAAKASDRGTRGTSGPSTGLREWALAVSL